jgi:drug/metabolite transporter (DMT)-like permease
LACHWKRHHHGGLPNAEITEHIDWYCDEGTACFSIGGGASFVAYAIVIWAFTQAPIALVTALRETSIIFALLIGVFFLKERLDLMKVLSTMFTLIGAILLCFAR